MSDQPEQHLDPPLPDDDKHVDYRDPSRRRNSDRLARASEQAARVGRPKASRRLVAAGFILAILNGPFPLFIPPLAVGILIIRRGRTASGVITLLLTFISPVIVWGGLILVAGGGAGGFAP
jgi:hypothetical protein